MSGKPLQLLFLLLALTVVACGKPSEKDLCNDVDCLFGVCQPTTGECTNPESCDDSRPCLEGFECVDDACVAEFSCNEDNPCDRGECVEGACVNPERCEVGGDCVPGFTCDGDQCVEDLCDQVECPRGVCEKSSGECVNAAVCTAETEDTDCLEDYVCYDQSCADEETVCADLECDRGVCSFVDLSCVNAESCDGDDSNCLEGSFCNAADQCQQNVCDANMVDCPRGECDQATGNCVNPDQCLAAEECIDGFYCIGNTCEEQEAACEACVGNQVCSYDDVGLQVTCGENPEGCTTTIDCTGSRECMGGQCGDPVACEPDDLEPNNSTSEATDWFTVDGLADATVCSGDADFYEFDVAEDPQFTGTLLAIVNIPTSDVGVGTLELELLDEAGATVASTTTGPTDTVARVEYAVGNINQGVYTLVIRDSGDVGDGGIEYSLFMDLADDNAVEACANAQPVGMTAVMGDTSTSTSNALGSSCVNEPDATEEIWKFEVVERGYATVNVTGTTFDATVSLRTQCEADTSELECANDVTGLGNETLGFPVEPGTYFVVVQGASGTEQGAYALEVLVEPVICTQADNSCLDMNTAEVCNGRGTGFVEEMCANGCDDTTGTCIREEADVCTTAIDARGGYTGSISLGSLTGDYDPGTACVPLDGSGSSVTAGPDAVFEVELGPDEVVYAQAAPVDFDYVSWYVVDDCTDVTSSCLAGANSADFDGDDELVYENTSGATRTLYVVLDSDSGASSSVDVEIITGARVCTPGMQQCNADDLETCNVAGTGYDARTCPFGCDTMTSDCVPPPNDVCGMGAVDVSMGGTFTGLIDDYANDYDNPNVCTGFGAPGKDAVYVMNGTVGDIVTVSLDTPYDASLYAVTACGDIPNTCLDGSDNVGQAEEITFVVRDSDPIYIIADAFTGSPSGMYTLDVTIETPDCTNYGQPIMCQPDGMTLQYCDDIGFFADYTCSTTCSSGACDDPSGDRCFDAIPIADGDSFTGNYGDYENSVDPGVGTCILTEGFGQPGGEAIFEIDLVQGDLLTASLTSDEIGRSMYILSDCGDARNSCEGAAARADTFEFFAQTTGTYYLVVDSTRSFASDDFTLDVDIQAGLVCLPGGATCDEPSDTLTYCNLTGTGTTTSVVCSGGCTDDYCNAPPTVNDTCMDAEVVNGPIRIVDNWTRFANDFDPASAMMNTCNLTGFSDGPDAVYEVTLAAGDVVDVEVQDLTSFGSPLVYIITDCADAAGTCVSSEDDGVTVRTGYASELGETVYVVVDSGSSFADNDFIVDIDIRPSQCTPNLTTCTGPDTREFCDQFGELQSETCFFGCNMGACNPPTNNTCMMPLDATGGGTFTLPIDPYTNDYDPGSGGCTGFSASGAEAVFQVSAAAGDIITAQLQTSDYDSAVYITTTCGDTMTCVDGDDSASLGDVEEAQVIAQMAGDYFIYADAFSSTPSGEFTLEIIQESPICTPADTQCDMSGQNIEVCNSTGTAFDVFPCDAAGCSAGATQCANATGEYCTDALDATAGGQFTGVFSDFADDYDLSSADDATCTGFNAPGPDVAYFVDLTMGQTLDATLNGNDDTSLYLLGDCATPVDTCLAGDDAGGSGETISYTAMADERVFIMVDAFDSGAADMYTLDVTIQ